jgi:potassium-transporting ATPase ATP-binding subunit
MTGGRVPASGLSVLQDRALLKSAARGALRKLHPRDQVRNPVMFMVYVGAMFITAMIVVDAIAGRWSGFTMHIAAWLWITVLFANLAEAAAESRGRAQADSLRATRTRLTARRLLGGREEEVSALDLRIGDLVVCEAQDIIPMDGEVTEGIASVDESAITGESAPVIRESGGDRSAVTGGTRVLSDRILVRITAEPGHTFIDRMIALVEGARRRKTPNEIALSLLLSGLSLVFLAVVVALYPFSEAVGRGAAAGGGAVPPPTVAVLVALLVCLIPTTIGGLLSAIGISGIDRLSRRNVIASSGRAVEAAGDIDVLLLDKTGTITLGNRVATDVIEAPGVDLDRLVDVAQLASLADETPEGRSVTILAKDLFGLRGREVAGIGARWVAFSAATRMSGVDIPARGQQTERIIRKGSMEAIREHVRRLGGAVPADVERAADEIARLGGTPLVVAENAAVLGIIHLKDVIKGGIRERFERLRAMGIRTVMITGDNALTAASIAAEAGIDEFLAQATPEDKLRKIREEQARGCLVAMTGDGTNDAPALAQADVGVAMNSGTQAAREAGNMVDLDSNPTKLIEIVEIGKQLLITRGALTTFSIANDAAKYFAILPALFGALYAGAGHAGPLAALDIMRLTSPESAILSAVIFNALIIVALIPLALRGVRFRPADAASLLRRNLLIYGAGGILAPFAGIKVIDLLLGFLHIV